MLYGTVFVSLRIYLWLMKTHLFVGEPRYGPTMIATQPQQYFMVDEYERSKYESRVEVISTNALRPGIYYKAHLPYYLHEEDFTEEELERMRRAYVVDEEPQDPDHEPTSDAYTAEEKTAEFLAPFLFHSVFKEDEELYESGPQTQRNKREMFCTTMIPPVRENVTFKSWPFRYIEQPEEVDENVPGCLSHSVLQLVLRHKKESSQATVHDVNVANRIASKMLKTAPQEKVHRALATHRKSRTVHGTYLSKKTFCGCEVYRKTRTANKYRDVIQEFDQYHQKLTALSRYFATMSVKMQNINNTKIGKQMIWDMMNFTGNFDTRDLLEHDGDKTRNLYVGLEKVTIPTEDQMTQFEGRIKTLLRWKTTYFDIYPANKKEVYPYIERAGSLSNSNLDTSFLSDIEITMASASQNLENFNKRTSTTKNVNIINWLNTISMNLKQLETIPKSISALLGVLKAHKDLLEDDVYKSSTFTMVSLIKDFESNRAEVTRNDDVRNKSLATLREIAPFDDLRREREENLKMQNALIKLHPFHNPKWAPGLIGGVEQFLNCSEYIKDPWLKKMIRHHNSILMTNELWNVTQLVYAMRRVNERIGDFASDQNVEMLEFMLKANELIPATKLPRVDLISDATDDAVAPPATHTFQKKANELVDNVGKMRELITNVISKLESLTAQDEFKQFEELCGLHKLINFTKDRSALHEAELPGIIDRVNKFAKLQELNSALSNLQAPFVEIEKLLKNDALRNVVSSIANSKNDVNAFHEHQDMDRFKGYLWTASRLFFSSESATNALAMIRLISDMKKDPRWLSKVIEMKNEVNVVQYAVDMLLEVPIDLVEPVSYLMKANVKNTAEYVKNARIFGEAVDMFDNEFKFVNAYKNITDLINDGLAVRALIDAHPDKEELKEKWGDFGKFKSDLERAYQGMNETILLMTVGSNIEDEKRARGPAQIASRLIHLKKLENYEIEVKGKIEVLKRLDVNTVPNGQEMLDTLKFLNSLDLNFAKHNVSILENAPAAAEWLAEASVWEPYKPAHMYEQCEKSNQPWPAICCKPDPIEPERDPYVTWRCIRNAFVVYISLISVPFFAKLVVKVLRKYGLMKPVDPSKPPPPHQRSFLVDWLDNFE